MMHIPRGTRPFTSISRARRVVSAVRPYLENLETRDLLALLAPTGVVATGISSSAISITWNASTDPQVTGYDVYSKTWVVGPHGGKGSGGSGHYVYSLLGANLTKPTDTISGLLSGTYHTYLVTTAHATSQSQYSLPASAETWVAPAFANGPNIFLLSVGAVWSGPVAATAGMTTQVNLLINGNPLTYSVVSGPSTASINAKSGVVTFTPTASEVGTVAVTFKAANSLGAITQTIQFNVAAHPNLPSPTIKLSSTSATFNGSYQQIAATAYAKDGVTRVNGAYAVAYNGSTGYLYSPGTYPVLVTFTSSDPNYSSATLLTNYTISKSTPTFSNLSSPSIAVGAAIAMVSGNISNYPAVPVGDYVIMTLNGVSQESAVDTFGNFSSTFSTAALPTGNDKVTYSFAGDQNFNAASTAFSTLAIVPLAVPVITVNPYDQTSSAGDGVSFTAIATGSPVVSVQWQVSTDGGLTFTDITGNASATTTTLSFSTTDSENGYKYRAVFTNSAGTTTSAIATLTMDTAPGGGGGN